MQIKSDLIYLLADDSDRYRPFRRTIGNYQSNQSTDQNQLGNNQSQGISAQNQNRLSGGSHQIVASDQDGNSALRENIGQESQGGLNPDQGGDDSHL